MSRDADGWKRGAKGIDGRKDENFAKPDFDRKRQYGDLRGIVGQRARVGDGEKLKQHVNGEQE